MRDLTNGELVWATWLREDPRRFLDYSYDHKAGCHRIVGLENGVEVRRGRTQYRSAREAAFVYCELVERVGRVCCTCAKHNRGRCADDRVRVLGRYAKPDSPCPIPARYRARKEE